MANVGKSWAFSLPPQRVRDPELDQFNVVNNNIIGVYFQDCRHEFLAAIGADCDAVARSGKALAVSEIKTRFLAPLRSRDQFRVDLNVQKVTPARVVFEQRIVRLPKAASEAEVPVATAEVHVVSLDKEYRPIEIDAEWKAKMEAFGK